MINKKTDEEWKSKCKINPRISLEKMESDGVLKLDEKTNFQSLDQYIHFCTHAD